MKRGFIKVAFLAYCLFSVLIINAQTGSVTLILNFPLPDTNSKGVYVAGSFNYWHVKDSMYRMIKEKDGVYNITLPLFSNHQYEYKYTLGSWDNVEIALNDSNIKNRKFYSTNQLVINDTVVKWKYVLKKESKPSPQMEKFNAMKDSVLGNLEKDLEGMKELFKPFIENLLQDKPNVAVNKRINKKAIRKIGGAYEKISQLFWDVFAMLTPEQKRKIGEAINNPAAKDDIINNASKALEGALKEGQ